MYSAFYSAHTNSYPTFCSNTSNCPKFKYVVLFLALQEREFTRSSLYGLPQPAACGRFPLRAHRSTCPCHSYPLSPNLSYLTAHTLFRSFDKAVYPRSLLHFVSLVILFDVFLYNFIQHVKQVDANRLQDISNQLIQKLT